MLNIPSRTGVLAAALTCLTLSGTHTRASDGQPEKLVLKSRYTGKVLIDGATRVILSVTLDGKGGGSGTLAFDPNITDGNKSTAIAVREIRVLVRLVRDEQQAPKGRRLYEVLEDGLDVGMADILRREPCPRWTLVRPLKEGAPCCLVFADKGGTVRDALMLA